MTDIRLGVVSDLHAEFWQEGHYLGVGAKIQKTLADADLILLAGDIDNGEFAVTTASILFPRQPVCLVAGNHEFYGNDYRQTLTSLKTAAAASPTVSFLDKNSYVATINGRNIRVLGVTLWTDFALYGTPDLSMFDGGRCLNDFRLIHTENGSLTPQETVLWHQEDKAWLLAELDKPFDGITVVMTHHAPVNFAIPPRFINDDLSPCFASKLENLFARDDVDLVVWGHTHHSVDQMIGKTRFISCQTGYVSATSFDKSESNQFGIVVTV